MDVLDFNFLFNNELYLEDRLDYLYDTIDENLIAGEFKKVDEVFKLLYDKDLVRDNFDIILGFLTITLCAKDKLKERQKLFEFTYNIICEYRTKDEADRIMVGLE